MEKFVIVLKWFESEEDENELEIKKGYYSAMILKNSNIV